MLRINVQAFVQALVVSFMLWQVRAQSNAWQSRQGNAWGIWTSASLALRPLPPLLVSLEDLSCKGKGSWTSPLGAVTDPSPKTWVSAVQFQHGPCLQSG